MTLLIISFAAGVLTVLAPCILPLLPIIIGGSVKESDDRWRPFVIALSLALTVIVFTLILKFSTAFIAIPQSVWTAISGSIIILFGLVSLFPSVWEKIAIRFNLQGRSTQLLSNSNQKKSRLGEVLIGLSLGPVFSSCSPTYFLILATVLPQSFSKGLVYLVAYALGLSAMLLIISLLGQKLVKRLRFAADSHGWFKRGLGILFILVGVGIISGIDKRIQTYVAMNSQFDITRPEQKLLRSQEENKNPSPLPSSMPTDFPSHPYPLYQEIVNPSGFVNSEPFQLKDLIGKKVILLDFMTYSCIDCIRTFPYLNKWHQNYRDQGLAIVGIHTPEFAFEKDINNVKAAMQKFGIEFPVVLDNEYTTWGAYQNNYWPRKYLIDLQGKIVYDHIGEGDYDETEAKIRELLGLSQENTAPSPNDVSAMIQEETSLRPSPETYFGSSRNTLLGNGATGKSGEQTLNQPEVLSLSRLYLQGTWNFTPEFSANTTARAKIAYRYAGRDVFLVASADKTVRVKVLLDGQPVSKEMAGPDIIFEKGESYVLIDEERLYTLVKSKQGFGVHTLELIIENPNLQVYTFTFG